MERHTELKQIREYLGFTQEEMAQRLQYNANYYSQWERGEAQVPFRIIRAARVMQMVAQLGRLFGLEYRKSGKFGSEC